MKSLCALLSRSVTDHYLSAALLPGDDAGVVGQDGADVATQTRLQCSTRAEKINLLKHASYFVKKNLSDSNICSCLNHADIYGQFNNGRSGNWLRESKFCAQQQLTHLLIL